MVLLGGLFVNFLSAADLKPQKLTVGEFFDNPLGYSLEDLTMSWQLPLMRNGIAQSAYRIVAANSVDELDSNPIWDTGKVSSPDSIKVPYGGKAPLSRQRIYWKVKVWDENGTESEWSDPAFFEAGLLSNSDWKGEWIFTPENIRPLYNCKKPIQDKNTKKWRFPIRNGVPPVYLRKEFVASKIVSARLYVASRGIFQAYINGRKVGDDYWGTGWTNYRKRIQCNAYDVTNMLYEGRNTIGFIVGDGWYSGRIAASDANRGAYEKKPEIIAQLEILFSDGSKLTVATDSSWKASFGGILYSDIYDGELFDASLEPDSWNENGFDDSSWKFADSKKLEAAPLLEPRRNQPIVVKDILYPISVSEVAEGTFIFDFGQNMVGWPVLNLPTSPDQKGLVIGIRYAEMLNKDGTMYTENYRSAISRDTYICKGNGEKYEPAFTFHGYRYVELSGLPKGFKPSKDWIISKVLYNDMPESGGFACSVSKVNILQSNIKWGQRGNYFSVPTDCPQRDERMGWTGDAQVFCPTAAFNMNVNAFFAKWCRDLLDAQLPNGAYPHVAPHGWGAGSPAWSDAGVICPWEVYLAYGDKKILSKNYGGMKKWIEYMKSSSKGLLRPDEGFGDWLQPSSTHGKDSAFWRGQTPRSLIGTAYFARCADIMAEVAKILGRDADSKEFSELAQNVRKAYIAAFVKPDGTVATGTQTGYLLTLAFDMLPKEMRDKTFKKFLKKLESDNYYLDTGFVGTPLLNPALTKFGRMDLAYRILLNEGYPSWLYSINQGATTMWERWNSYSHDNGFGEAAMNSFNHYAYGAIGEWMYRDIAGLWHDKDSPGYKNIIFAPKPGGGLKFASAYHDTPYGRAESSWRFTERGDFEWNVQIPANSTGTLVIPANNIGKVFVNGEKAASLVMNLPSGKYTVIVEK